MLQDQNNKCKLSQIDLVPERAVLDHAHSSGRVRAVLDRGVNAFLGKIENNMARNRITKQMLKVICENLIKYIEEETDTYHPTYKTPEEKKALTKKRRARAK